MLATNVEQQGALLGRETACAPAIRAWRWLERSSAMRCLESAAAIRVEPALDRREAVLLACAPAGRPIATRGDRAKRFGELPARQLAVCDGADDLGTKQGDDLGVIARSKRRFFSHGSRCHAVSKASPIQRGGLGYAARHLAHP